MLKLIRALAFVIGVGSLVFSSISFWGVSVTGMLQPLNIGGIAYLSGILVWLGFSMYIALWSINQQSLINYLRLLGLSMSVVLIFYFDKGPPHGIFGFALSFIGVQILWNALLSVLQRIFFKRAQGVAGKKNEALSTE